MPVLPTIPAPVAGVPVVPQFPHERHLMGVIKHKLRKGRKRIYSIIWNKWKEKTVNLMKRLKKKARKRPTEMILFRTYNTEHITQNI